ncbi:MAG TPA: hypothetical protein DDZ68_02135 [Parvularcula sp.]|nr:hypothetical protein [Parvularcula sp.]HBS30959.1 hypothetical protein [Parvularcula sp.]HBS34960.1 hypothetical protein [Parvularcula sp.]
MKLSPVIIIALAALVGGGGGVGLRAVLGAEAAPQASEEAGGENADEHAGASADKKADAKAPEEKEAHASDDKHDKGEKKSKKKADDKHGQKAEEAAYFKFSRQFVAPIVKGGEPRAMMILDVMIELAPGANEAIYSEEPKLRDAVLKALLAQSANGELPDMLTDPALLETTRGAVLANVREILGEDARSVLLMDVGYQPY